MQAENERRVDGRDGLDAVAILLNLQPLGDLVAVVCLVVVESESGLENVVAEPFGSVGDEKLAVEIVSDAATILCLGDHILDGHPRYRLAYHHRNRHVFLQELQARVQIGIVVLIRNTPADGPELATLLHDTVEEGLHIDQCPPLFVVDLVEQLLRDHRRVGSEDASLQASWRLESHLDGDLQKSNREPRCNFASDPESEIVVNFGCLEQNILELAHVANAEMRVLQDDPTSRDEGEVVLLTRNLFLPFSHRDLVGGVLFLLLGQLID
mmetsp:Transcript_54158/g.115606  ORF Transcript_54158/g.115606 Transcript_54158/m.115606 type:complete len:268 (+) Transcript_54158:1502-2305(+)